MQNLLEELAAALRDELEEYGEMLALLAEQQEAIFARKVEEVSEIDEQIEGVAATIGLRRQRREEKFCQAALAYDAPQDRPLKDILPSFPESQRPLFTALIDEINDLLEVTRRKARQNQILLGRILETAREVLQSFSPEPSSAGYDSRGRPAGAGGIAKGTFQTRRG